MPGHLPTGDEPRAWSLQHGAQGIGGMTGRLVRVVLDVNPKGSSLPRREGGHTHALLLPDRLLFPPYARHPGRPHGAQWACLPSDFAPAETAASRRRPPNPGR